MHCTVRILVTFILAARVLLWFKVNFKSLIMIIALLDIWLILCVLLCLWDKVLPMLALGLMCLWVRWGNNRSIPRDPIWWSSIGLCHLNSWFHRFGCSCLPVIQRSNEPLLLMLIWGLLLIKSWHCILTLSKCGGYIMPNILDDCLMEFDWGWTTLGVWLYRTKMWDEVLKMIDSGGEKWRMVGWNDGWMNWETSQKGGCAYIIDHFDWFKL